MAVVQEPRGLRWFLEGVQPGVRINDAAAAERIRARYALAVEPESRFDTFDHPALFVMGRQDPDVGFEDQLALLPSYPRATAAVLDAAGHNAHYEQPEIVDALLDDWLSRMDAAGGA